MALPQQQIDSILAQLTKFGDDGVAFDAWMDTVTPHVRAHGHVGKFRTEARSLWLTHNKKGVEKLVRDLLGGPSHAERTAQEQGELVGDMAERAFYSFLCRMGICKGDTLTVHAANGDVVPLKFDDDRLPARAPARAKKTLVKPAAKADVVTKKTMDEAAKPAPKKRRTRKKKSDDTKPE